jgi:8-oxo-dGTP diphosphatase
MKREYPDHPVIGVLAIVRRGAEVLIVQRARWPSIGRWGFPGGVQELGETVMATARRELEEETAVQARPLISLPVIDVIRPDAEGRIQAHWTLVPVVCDWEAGEGAPSDEVQAVRWIRPQAIADSGLDAFPDLDRLARLAFTLPTL